MYTSQQWRHKCDKCTGSCVCLRVCKCFFPLTSQNDYIFYMFRSLRREKESVIATNIFRFIIRFYFFSRFFLLFNLICPQSWVFFPPIARWKIKKRVIQSIVDFWDCNCIFFGVCFIFSLISLNFINEIIIRCTRDEPP